MSSRLFVLMHAVQRVRSTLCDAFGTSVGLSIIGAHMANMRPEDLNDSSTEPFRIQEVYAKPSPSRQSARCTIALQRACHPTADALIQRSLIHELTIGLESSTDHIVITDTGEHVPQQRRDSVRSICRSFAWLCRERGIPTEVSPLLHLQITTQRMSTYGVVGLAMVDKPRIAAGDGRHTRGL